VLDSEGRADTPVETITAPMVVLPPRDDDRAALDALLGLGVGAAALAWRASPPLRWVAQALVAAASVATPDVVASTLAVRGRAARDTLDAGVRRVLQLVVPAVVRSALATLDLNALVRDHVDLDGLAAELDVAAVIDRVDLDAVVSRVDIEAVIDGVDLDSVVRRVDLNAVVDRVDLDAVAARLDLDAVAARLDLDRLIESVDVKAVLARLDLAGIAEEVMAAVDLPEILRESSGTLASEAIRGVRTGGMKADDAVGRFVDRLLRRSAGTATSAAP
jgi:hypothetical protein